MVSKAKILRICILSALAVFIGGADSSAQFLFNKNTNNQSDSKNSTTKKSIWNSQKSDKKSNVYTAPVPQGQIQEKETKAKKSYKPSQTYQASPRYQAPKKTTTKKTKNIIDASKCGAEEYKVYQKYKKLDHAIQQQSIEASKIPDEDFTTDFLKLQTSYADHMDSILSDPRKSERYFSIMMNCAEATK